MDKIVRSIYIYKLRKKIMLKGRSIGPTTLVNHRIKEADRLLKRLILLDKIKSEAIK